MRTAALLASLAAVAVAAAPAIGAEPAGPAERICVENVRLVNLTGLTGQDSLIRASIEAMLRRPTLVLCESEWQRKSTIARTMTDELPNPFAGEPAGGSAIAADLTVEIERVEYTRSWGLGLVGQDDGSTVAGTVQVRATLLDRQNGREIRAVAIGTFPGKAKDLPRTRALDTATRRTCWELVGTLGFAARKEWKLNLKSESRRTTLDKYWALVDSTAAK